MLNKGKQSRPAAGKPERRAAKGKFAPGLRLLAGSIIVLASLTLVLYAARVEAAIGDEPGPQTVSLLPWLPLFALAFLALLVPAWRSLRERSRSNQARSANPVSGNGGDVAVAFAQHTDKPPKNATGSNKNSSPEQFQTALERHFLICRKQSSYLALSVVAIDNFEPLADAIGQDEITERVHQTALSLHSLVRGQGGVFDGPRVNDRGHFLALIPNTDPDRALQVSEDIRMAVEDLGYDNPLPPRRIMTASLGLAVMIPDDRIPQRTLFNAADQALVRSQRLGGNRVEVEMIDSRPDQ